MANALYDETYIQAIADAIRAKNNSTNAYYVSQMADEILALGSPSFETQEKIVTPSDQLQTVIPDSGYAGLSKVTVNEIPNTYVKLPDPIVAGDYPIYGLTTESKITSTSYTDLGLYIFTANRAGTYRFKWCCMKPAMQLGGSGTPSSALFLNDVQQYENTSFSNNTQYNQVDVTMAVGDVVRVKAKHSGGMYATYIYGVNVCIDWGEPNAFFVR